MAVLALAVGPRTTSAPGSAGWSSRRRATGQPITAEDLQVAGAMAVLLKDAIKPNLLQTLEGGPAFVHCGPFANIAHGNNSVLADRVALATNEIVCTEAGFGADMGAEKFFDIKCRASGLRPDAAVVVATIRALKMHGGVGRIVAGKPLDPALLAENVAAVTAGGANLAKQIENVRLFNVPVVVAINSFPTDTPAEVEAVRAVALAAGAREAVVARHWAKGGEGAEDLADRGLGRRGGGRAGLQAPLPGRRPAHATRSRRSRPRSTAPPGSTSAPAAAKQLAQYEALGFGRLPICMAKSQYSLSHDAALKGRPTGFRLRSARSGSRRARDSSRRSSARCGRCPGCRRSPAARTSTSTPTGRRRALLAPYSPRMIVQVLVALAGILLIARTVFSAVRTFVVPRGENDQLSRVLFTVVRRAFNLAAPPSRSYAQRDRVMAYYGPVALMLLPAFWLVLLVLGFGAIYWALGMP